MNADVVLDIGGRIGQLIAAIGFVQIVMHFLKRRSELKALDVATTKAAAEADQFVVDSAKVSLALSDQVRDNAVRSAVAADLKSNLLVVELGIQVQKTREVLLELEAQVAKTRQVTSRLEHVEQECIRLNAEITALKEAAAANS